MKVVVAVVQWYSGSIVRGQGDLEVVRLRQEKELELTEQTNKRRCEDGDQANWAHSVAK